PRPVAQLRAAQHDDHLRRHVASQQGVRPQRTPCSVEFLIDPLLALTPKAVPRLVTLPSWICVQEPPVLPVMIESWTLMVPVQSLLVMNTPPPKAPVPALLFSSSMPHRMTLVALPPSW